MVSVTLGSRHPIVCSQITKHTPSVCTRLSWMMPVMSAQRAISWQGVAGIQVSFCWDVYIYIRIHIHTYGGDDGIELHSALPVQQREGQQKFVSPLGPLLDPVQLG